jgi:phosphoribosylformylglycinamidine cyclo-ligase
VSETLAAELAYTGPYHLNDRLPGTERSVAWGLLSPTRTYLPVVRAVLASDAAKGVTGILHCTGGGQTKCRFFGRGLHYVKDDLFAPPALFRAIQAQGIDAREMFEVFNMGHRMELYVRPGQARAVIDVAAGFGVESRVVGRIEANHDTTANRVTVRSGGRTHEYV